MLLRNFDACFHLLARAPCFLVLLFYRPSQDRFSRLNSGILPFSILAECRSSKWPQNNMPSTCRATTFTPSQGVHVTPSPTLFSPRLSTTHLRYLCLASHHRVAGVLLSWQHSELTFLLLHDHTLWLTSLHLLTVPYRAAHYSTEHAFYNPSACFQNYCTTQ